MEPTFSSGWFETFGRPDETVTVREVELLLDVLMAVKAARTLVLDVYDPSFFRAHQGTTDNRGVRDEKRVEGDRLLTSLDYPDGTSDE